MIFSYIADNKIYGWGETLFGKIILSEPKIILEPKEIPITKFSNIFKIMPTANENNKSQKNFFASISDIHKTIRPITMY